MKDIGTYRLGSNITTSISIKKYDEKDYLALRKMIRRQRLSLGEYMMDCYRELDKDVVDINRLRTLHMKR
tara:strand:+ start:1680 stop:1889 length:210 start_codon:yes stop_codon:yes gene_type:complete